MGIGIRCRRTPSVPDDELVVSNPPPFPVEELGEVENIAMLTLLYPFMFMVVSGAHTNRWWPGNFPEVDAASPIESSSRLHLTAKREVWLAKTKLALAICQGQFA